MRRAALAPLALSLLASAGPLGCDGDALSVAPELPDAGFEEPVDAGFPDTGLVFPDAAAGFPDAAEPPPAREPIYIHTGDTLYSYDPETHIADPIGMFRSASGPITDMADIAIDLDGRMFGGTVEQVVYAIDPSTGFCRRRFEFDDRLNGLTFLSDGTLVVAGERVSLIDPGSGRMIREMVGAERYETSGDIVGLPDGKLYWTVRGERNGNGDRVIRIDPETGRAEELGVTNVQRIYGLGYADGILYGFSSDGVVVHIDATTGVVIRERSLSARWWGATTNPVLWR